MFIFWLYTDSNSTEWEIPNRHIQEFWFILSNVHKQDLNSTSKEQNQQILENPAYH